jgi:hypothetical protein
VVQLLLLLAVAVRPVDGASMNVRPEVRLRLVRGQRWRGPGPAVYIGGGNGAKVGAEAVQHDGADRDAFAVVTEACGVGVGGMVVVVVVMDP